MFFSFPFSFCSVWGRWVGGAQGEDRHFAGTGSRLLWHGLWGHCQGHCQRRGWNTSSGEDGERVGQPAGENRVPERGLRHESLQLPPRGKEKQHVFLMLFMSRGHWWFWLLAMCKSLRWGWKQWAVAVCVCVSCYFWVFRTESTKCTKIRAVWKASTCWLLIPVFEKTKLH